MRVDEGDDEVEAALLVEVAGDEVGPALALFEGDLGVTVAGQVYQSDAVRLVEVYVCGLAWLA
jgi:hypothetical protein